jgi:hypothetical protein
MSLHVGYESRPPSALEEVGPDDDRSRVEWGYRVQKMTFGKGSKDKDRSTIGSQTAA